MHNNIKEGLKDGISHSTGLFFCQLYIWNAGSEQRYGTSSRGADFPL